MASSFRACDRDQALLLPPDVREWLPADHMAWFILDVVDQLDLGPFLKAYRADGHGHAAYEPRMLLDVLLYGSCAGLRSSQIERRCREDIAFRVLAGNSTPDHVTIARFRVRPRTSSILATTSLWQTVATTRSDCRSRTRRSGVISRRCLTVIRFLPDAPRSSV